MYKLTLPHISYEGGIPGLLLIFLIIIPNILLGVGFFWGLLYACWIVDIFPGQGYYFPVALFNFFGALWLLGNIWDELFYTYKDNELCQQEPLEKQNSQ